VNEDKMDILKKYEHVFDEQTLKRLLKNPIIFSKRKFRIELEKLYNEHTRRLMRTKSKSLSLSDTMKNIYLINNKKSKAIEFAVRMVYTADKYSSQIPEAKAFLDFLKFEFRQNLIFYLLLRLVFKIHSRATFLDHLNGKTSFEELKLSYAKAKNYIQIAATNNENLSEKLVLRLKKDFKPNASIKYYPFLCHFSEDLGNIQRFNMIGELTKVHLGKRIVHPKPRFEPEKFEQEKFESQNPFENEIHQEEIIEKKLKEPEPVEEFKSTTKMIRGNTFKSSEKRDYRSRVTSEKSPGKQTLKPMKRKLSHKIIEKKKTLQERIIDLDDTTLRKKERRVSLLVKVEKILENYVEKDERQIIEKIERELQIKSEKIVNKFIERFQVDKNEIDEYGQNLGFTIFNKSQLAMAFVITKERKKFFALMRKSNIKSEKYKNVDLNEHWDLIYETYNKLLGNPTSSFLLRSLAIELFKFPIFKSEIVFILKYFFKVSYR
jgi:hypothetical protein